MKVRELDEKQILANLSQQKNPFFGDYYAYYSSWLGGITKNPALMLLPMDDHMVHRGDGVFEAVKVVNRAAYLFDEHLERLFRSAEKIGIQSSLSYAEMKEIVLETLRVADQRDAVIRIFLSRGPGNFSPNPYDALGAQFYVVITRLKTLSAEKYAEGVVIGQSAIPTKNFWWAQIKSCNYLPNVMMKKEAVDRGLDFVIGIDEKGFIAESATENIMIVDENNILVHPELDFILKGITMTRVCELAEENGMKMDIRPISIKDLKAAREVIMTGTTLDVIRVAKFEGCQIGKGDAVMSHKLRELLLDDIHRGPRRMVF